MIAVLSGENSFALRQRLNELVDKFVAKYGNLAVEKFDAEEVEGERVIESVLALPFLTAHKMVVLRAGSANSVWAERIEQTISSIPSSTDLILYEPQLDKRTVYFKVLKKQPGFEELNNLDKMNLAKWLVAEAEKQGAKISFGDANYLVERLGENQQLLFNELAKLAVYNPDISKESIDLLTEPTPQSKVFDLLDAAFSDKKGRALELYEDQR